MSKIAKRAISYLSFFALAGVILLSCATFYTDKSKQIKIATGRLIEGNHGYVSIPPSDNEFDSISGKLQNAFSKYPEDFLAEHIDYVVIYKRLFYLDYFEDERSELAGTIGKRTVFVTLRDGLWYVENVFHHEFNHLLAEEYYALFDKEKWKSFNPSDFDYQGRYASWAYVEMHGTSQPWFDTTCLHQGFLSEYSKTRLIEDLARYAEALFMSSREFWDAYDRFENVKGKAKLAIDFYNKLHPIFTEEYFRELTIQQEGIKN